jgi:hypothetical protein
MTVNALRNRSSLLLLAAAPLGLILLALSLGWSLILPMTTVIAASYLFSCYLYYRGRLVGVAWLPAWIVAFIVLVPYANILFVVICWRRLNTP